MTPQRPYALMPELLAGAALPETFDRRSEVTVKPDAGAEAMLRISLAASRATIACHYLKRLHDDPDLARFMPTLGQRRLWFARYIDCLERVTDALLDDRRMTREAWFHLARHFASPDKLPRSCPRKGEALHAMALALAGMRALPVIAAGSMRVIALVEDDGSVSDLIGWPANQPTEWVTRTGAHAALAGRLFDDPFGEMLPDPSLPLRLCETPASWHAAGGHASAAVCVLDWDDERWLGRLKEASALICDTDDHGAAVQAFLKAQRPKLPSILVSEPA